MCLIGRWEEGPKQRKRVTFKNALLGTKHNQNLITSVGRFDVVKVKT